MGFSLTDLSGITDLEGSPPSDAGATLPVTAIAPGMSFQQPKGCVRRYSVQLLDPSTGLPLLGIFDGTEALRAFAWEGGDGPTVATPAVSWDQASPPFLYLDVMPADLAPLLEQPYPLRIEVDRGGQWQAAFQCFIDVLPEPATAPASLPVYGSYQDLLEFGGNGFVQLLTPDQGAGFAKARAEARKWLDSIIIARYRPMGGAWGGFAGYGSIGVGMWNTLDTPNRYIKQYLDSNFLIVTDTVRRAVSRKALGLIFARQDDPDWRVRSAEMQWMADQDALCLVAQIDTNGDGNPEYSINCGVFNTRNV